MENQSTYNLNASSITLIKESQFPVGMSTEEWCTKKGWICHIPSDSGSQRTPIFRKMLGVEGRWEDIQESTREAFRKAIAEIKDAGGIQFNIVSAAEAMEVYGDRNRDRLTKDTYSKTNAALSLSLSSSFTSSSSSTLPQHIGSADWNATALIRGQLPLELGKPKIHIVTYAYGEKYLTSQQHVISSALPSAHFIYAWNRSTLNEYFPHHVAVWAQHEPEKTTHKHYCVGMKSVLTEHAMTFADEGDWIVWMDSSQHISRGFSVHFDSFVQSLIKSGVDAYPGSVLCGHTNIDQPSFGGLISRKTFSAFDLDRPRYWFAPHFRNNFFAFAKTNRSTTFLREWTDYSTNNETYCASLVEDQAPFSLLVSKHRYPIVSLCGGLNEPPYEHLKDVVYILERIDRNKHRIFRDSDDFQSTLPIKWDEECSIRGKQYRARR